MLTSSTSFLPPSGEFSSRGVPSVWLGAALGAIAAGCVCLLTPLSQAAIAGSLAFGVFAWWIIAHPARWVRVLLIALLCLPPLPFAFGNSGPHPALAIAGLGIISGLLRWREWTVPLPHLAIALLLLPTVLLLTIPFAAWYSGAPLAAASLARVLLFCLPVYVFFYAAGGPVSRLSAAATLADTRMLFAAAVAAAVFACVDFFYQLPTPAGFGPQYVWLDLGVYRRAQGLFYEASTLGNMCVFFLTGAAVAIAQGRVRTLAGWFGLPVGVVALLAALLFSFSRGSIIALACALLALAGLHARGIPWARVIAGLSAGLFAAITVVYLLSPVMVEFYWLRLRISAAQIANGNAGVLSGRLENWTYLGNFLIEQPWHALLGVGYKTLPYSDVAGKPIVADNTYLSALVETGVPGLCALLLFHVAVFALAWRGIRSRNPHARFYGAWIGCFWFAEAVQMLSGDLLTYWRVLPLYLWVLALAVRFSTEPSDEAGSPPNGTLLPAGQDPPEQEGGNGRQ